MVVLLIFPFPLLPLRLLLQPIPQQEKNQITHLLCTHDRNAKFVIVHYIPSPLKLHRNMKSNGAFPVSIIATDPNRGRECPLFE